MKTKTIKLIDKKQTRRKNKKAHIKKSNTMRAYKQRFSEKYYNSGDGMLTTVWGPAMWHYLHTLSFNYPVNPTDENKKYYKQFIENLQHTLPCKYCRNNFQKNLKILPVTENVLLSRNTFSRYVYDLHNLVNKMLGKHIHISYEEVRDRYENFRARCSKKQILQRTIKIKKIKNYKDNNDNNDGKHKGCTQPLYGEKSKCIIKIVPQSNKSETFIMDTKCERKI
jgi:hypothetical protein